MKELHEKIPDNWPNWNPAVSGLGSGFLKGLSKTVLVPYPDPKFKLKSSFTMNTLWSSHHFFIKDEIILKQYPIT
jgi:hypothetical protein